MMHTPCRYSVNSEYKPLHAILLYKPGPEIEAIDKPLDILHRRIIDYKLIEKEYEEIIELYKRLKIKVYFIDNKKSGNVDSRYLFNMMYVRDLFFMTPAGAILSSMAYDVRLKEVQYAETTLRNMDVPIRKIVKPRGTLEGADALWLNNRLVVIGVGNRSNVEGFSQVKDELETQDIDCISVSAPRNTQHLLGALQFVDSDLALVRVDLVDLEIINFLKRNKIEIIDIHEDEEVRDREAMNIVTIAPREIIMPTGCPRAKKIYENHGIRIAGEAKINQLINGGGGLACATAIIARAS